MLRVDTPVSAANLYVMANLLVDGVTITELEQVYEVTGNVPTWANTAFSLVGGLSHDRRSATWARPHI
jgi:hypothetical protein